MHPTAEVSEQVHPPSAKNGTLQSDTHGHSRWTSSALLASAIHAFW